jgi:hypothetical protein
MGPPHFAIKPGPRNLPVTFYRRGGYTQLMRNLLNLKSTEKTHLDDPTLARVDLRQSIQASVQLDQFDRPHIEASDLLV